MGAGEKLFFAKNLYGSKNSDELFLRAVRENAAHHIKNCPEYAEILKAQGFDIPQLKTIDDIYKIPPLPTLFLKRHALYSVNPKRLALKSSTSGTSGTKSYVGFDFRSSIRGAAMVLKTFKTHKLFSGRLTNYIVLGYEPSKHLNLGAMKTAYATTYAAPAAQRAYALVDTGTDYKLNTDGLIETLIRYEKQGLPVRFMGFPAYLLFLLTEMQERGISVKLHKKSLIMLAGGWKQFFSERLEKADLYALSEEILGIGGDRFQEFFGAVEHPIVYADCKNHHFHVPVYARAIIRDTGLKPLPNGTAGLLNLITPMMTAMPYLSVMTDDIAIMHSGDSCGCGIKTPYIEILGRSGIADVKTCGAGAGELLSVLKNTR